jgi:hypothetical protein
MFLMLWITFIYFIWIKFMIELNWIRWHGSIPKLLSAQGFDSMTYIRFSGISATNYRASDFNLQHLLIDSFRSGFPSILIETIERRPQSRSTIDGRWSVFSVYFSTVFGSKCLIHNRQKSLTSFWMFPQDPIFIDHEFGASHTYFHNRSAGRSRSPPPVPPPEAVVQETGVVTWMAKLSDSAYSYHSRGRASRPVIRNWPAKTAVAEFIPNAHWQMQTESSVSFHATGIRKSPAREMVMPSTIVTNSTESSICFHCRSA